MKNTIDIILKLGLLLLIVLAWTWTDMPNNNYSVEFMPLFLKNLKAFAPGFLIILCVSIYKLYNLKN